MEQRVFSNLGMSSTRARKDAGTSYFDQLNAMGLAYVRFAGEHRAHFEVMFGLGGEALQLDPDGSKVADRAFGILEETIRGGQSSGEMIEGDPVEIARMVWSLVHGISLLGLRYRCESRLRALSSLPFVSLICAPASGTTRSKPYWSQC